MAPPREAQSISDLQELNNTAFQRQSKESSTSSNDTTDEEIVDLVQKAPVVTLRNKIGTQVGTDANFNTIKPKRWSDYRASWNQSFAPNQLPEAEVSRTNLYVFKDILERHMITNRVFQRSCQR